MHLREILLYFVKHRISSSLLYMFHPLKRNISPSTYPNHAILVSLEREIKGFPMILKSHDLDKLVAKYFISKMKYIEILKKHKKDTEKCTIQYLFSMSVSFPYHFSIFSVSEFFIGELIGKFVLIACFLFSGERN